jgi:hypothetical protein
MEGARGGRRSARIRSTSRTRWMRQASKKPLPARLRRAGSDAATGGSACGTPPDQLASFGVKPMICTPDPFATSIASITS